MNLKKMMTVGLALCLGATMGLSVMSCKDDEPTPEIVDNPLDKDVYFIAGRVVADNKALEGVKVSASDVEATTDAQGTFQLELKLKSDYAVTFEKSGYIKVASEISIPKNVKKQSVITVEQELSALNPAVTVTPDAPVTIVEAKEKEMELYLPAGAVKTNTDITITAYKEGTKKSETGTVRASLSTINCEPDGIAFEKPVALRMKNPVTNKVYFAEVKHYVEKGGEWSLAGNADFDGQAYYVATVNSFSNHSFSVACTSQPSTQKVNDLEPIVIDNLGDMAAKDQKINATVHVGWKIDGVTKDLLKNQLSGLSNADLTELATAVENVLSSMMGGTQGVNEMPLTRDVKVSGDTKSTVAVSEKISDTAYRIPVVYNNETISLNIPVVKYEYVDLVITTELGESHGGLHSGGTGGVE